MIPYIWHPGTDKTIGTEITDWGNLGGWGDKSVYIWVVLMVPWLRFVRILELYTMYVNHTPNINNKTEAFVSCQRACSLQPLLPDPCTWSTSKRGFLSFHSHLYSFFSPLFFLSFFSTTWKLPPNVTLHAPLYRHLLEWCGAWWRRVSALSQEKFVPMSSFCRWRNWGPQEERELPYCVHALCSQPSYHVAFRDHSRGHWEGLSWWTAYLNCSRVFQLQFDQEVTKQKEIMGKTCPFQQPLHYAFVPTFLLEEVYVSGKRDWFFRLTPSFAMM